MDSGFSGALSELRRSRDLSQRKLAGDLHISQSLLSHYENGTREPGLLLVCRICDYFGVTADFLLGRGGSDAGCLPAAFTALMQALDGGGSALRLTALGYLGHAAEKLRLWLDGAGPVPLAELAAAMTQAELETARLAGEARAINSGLKPSLE
ncbi:MAG: helix-turn-helix domain-containing protein [Oscillospiraceae bacterium]|jgi:transcriptional regulator with XRE-family HTH domain|nr:helix-turn-helix domain-containing protein [Oscillospiraceae bacterium]